MSDNSQENIEAELPIQLPEIHPSWIKDAPNGTLIEKLRQNSNFESKLMKLVSQHITIEEFDVENTKGFLNKLHTKTPYELQEIVLKAGAAQLSKKIRQTISKQDVKKIRDSLGDDLYNFALHEAPITFPITPMGSNLLTTNLNPLVHVIDSGYHSLRVVLEKFPNNCFLKLPKHWNNAYSSERLDSVDQREHILHMNLISKLV